MRVGMRSGWSRVSLTAALVLCTVFLVAPRRDVRGQAAASKLTTVLADLAGSVRQGQGAVLQDRAGQATPFAIDAMPRSVRHAVQTRRLRIDANNAVQVYVLLQAVTADALQQLTANGVTIEVTDVAHRRVQARVPVGRLQAVAALPAVTFVRLPSYAVRRTGSVTTEGDAILRSDAVRSQLGLDGTGVRIGVISDGLKGVFAAGCTTCGGIASGPIALGDLPSATGTRTSAGTLTSSGGGITGRSFQTNGDLEGLISGCSAAPGAGAEGTALLEVLHDIAPNAQLSFANFDTDLAFNQAVNFLASTNDIVVDDIGFYGESSDGTSSVSSNTAAALNNPANRIRAYVTSAGNAADEHYIGTYLDSGVDGTTIPGIINPGDLHRFQLGPDTTDVLNRGPQPYNLISLPAGGEVLVFLTWNDQSGGSTNNYDLYLVQESTGKVVASSTDVQNGGGDPVEVLGYVNDTGAAGFFQIVVQNVANEAAPRDLNIFSFQPECATDGPRVLVTGRHERYNYNTATRSMSAQSDAGGTPVGVISVGAICSASAAAVAAFGTSESCRDASHSTIEFYSSRGPTIDGRNKPDIAGIDGVSVTGAGRFSTPFFGTSAAAPHVAGIAALALQAAPCLASGASGAIDPDTARGALRSLLLNSAVPLGDANTFGAGRVDALASIQSTLPVFSGSPTLVVSGDSAAGGSVTASQLGFADPNQCQVTRLKWTGGCGTSPGASLTCPFGTSNVSVSATNNGVAFSAPTAVQVTVTTFAVGASPASTTITSGDSAVYQLTVSPQGGPFASPVTLGCAKLPPLATCSFDPPTVVPGANGGQTTLTIRTTALASLPPAPVSGWPQAGVLAAAMGLALCSIAVWRIRTDDRPASPSAAGIRLAAIGGASLASVVSLVLLLAPIACSGGSNPSPAPAPAVPSVALSAASLTFPTQFVQTTSATQTVTLTNSGKAALTLAGITATGDFTQTNACGSSLAAGANCAIAVAFAPTAAGTRTGAVSVNDNAAGSPHTVGLTGTGQTPTGTPAGSYQVSVTGTAGALVQSGTVGLVVVR